MATRMMECGARDAGYVYVWDREWHVAGVGDGSLHMSKQKGGGQERQRRGDGGRFWSGTRRHHGRDVGERQPPSRRSARERLRRPGVLGVRWHFWDSCDSRR